MKRVEYWNTKISLSLILCFAKYPISCPNGMGKTPEPRSNEFISALAAGMKSKLIVEVKSSVSPSTLALASAAKHTGAKFVCILPEAALPEVERESKDLVNPKRAVVVATNLSDDKQGLGAHIVGKKNKVPVRSMKHIPLRKEWKLPQLEKPTQVEGMIRVVEVTLERKLKGEFR
ncbi:hypothetical protein GOBAR_AA19491 [Gossypium barbadense]|uniref:Uncharacterized protein n=1 Tax=Gossypium barbadense TaxID=3634 RepID=A0A2P5XCV8_GOSBA|nr:hypothetical protein GOBAR_AA19491 [Gossypium barbadense]